MRRGRATAVCFALWLAFVVAACGTSEKPDADAKSASGKDVVNEDGTDTSGFVHIRAPTVNLDSIGMMADVPGVVLGR